MACLLIFEDCKGFDFYNLKAILEALFIGQGNCFILLQCSLKYKSNAIKSLTV